MARLLDAGAYGLVIPHVSTPEQAALVAAAMRYPPRGTRSSGAGRSVTLAPDYGRRINDVVLCIPQIEDPVGIANAEAIARVPGVDIGFLGPNDLALAMRTAPGSAEHEAALRHFREGCARAGKPCGIPVADAAAARRRIAEGFQFIDLASDLALLRSIAAQQVGDLSP